jgi:glycosyltransferase involved in cell wall biosynthesis
LIQPSRYEGFGLTILEGFAAGLPVLASDIDGPAEIIKAMPAGFLFKNADIDHCAKELFKIFVAYENDEIDTLIKRTIPILKQKYSIKSCVKEYLEEYRQLVKPAIKNTNNKVTILQ